MRVSETCRNGEPGEPGEPTVRAGGGLLDCALYRRVEDGAVLGALVWDAGAGWRMLSSGVLGGGLGTRSFVVNAQVAHGYRRMDPADHLGEIAAAAGVRGAGVGLLTAAEVGEAGSGADGGVEAVATAGIGRPTWAAADPVLDEARLGVPGSAPEPGTINIVVAIPAALSDAALVNVATTVTEAKVQAVMSAGFACTGTASDALCVAVRDPARRRAPGPTAEFGGPRSYWGARAARAVHAAVHQAARRYAARATAGS
ncbi:adenosylcobinamide amidohydrolase [Nocardiopsis mangrovi]|uniref:Adenosylcobinamide amidohydrolase n=1 Tax=Nocardiopsis mangrovi TaxID=1179818 RepID=A0ABV9DUM8_9ACTN